MFLYDLFWIFLCNLIAGRNVSSNNKSGSVRRAEASGSKTGFAKSSGTTIGFNYSSPNVQVSMPNKDFHFMHLFCCLLYPNGRFRKTEFKLRILMI